MPTVSVKKKNANGTASTENETQITCGSGEGLWQALEKQGFKLPSSCLKGFCAACRVEVISGAENLSSPSQDELETIAIYTKNKSPTEIQGKTIRLSCQAKVEGQGNVEVIPLD